MAETLMIGGNEYKKRNPLGVWALALVTIGIYFLVWYYKINREARDYLGDNEIRPGIALLAVTLGWLIIVPPFVSTYRTGQRIERMQERAQVMDRVSPGIGLLLFIFSRLDMIYYQEHLNRIWRRYLETPSLTATPDSPQLSSGEFST
jgi:Domain of unknown function (DUF4234)